MKAGFYKTNLRGEFKYKSFYPNPLQEIVFDNFTKTTVDLLSKANYEIGKLNGLSVNIKDMDLFIGSYVRKEALYSSQIEGTQATLEDVFDPSKDEFADINIKEVINYVKAIKYGLELVNDLPISLRYIKQIHEVLMKDVRGNERNPGEFRKSQNWLGGIDSTIKNAKFIPPNVEDMEECMDLLEKYIHDDTDVDELIKVALIHYQFETIHPFLDGNGRVGRLLIIIYLIYRNKLTYPCLYISYFLKRNQLEYYDRMSALRNGDDYVQWINFFLQGIIEISQEASNCIEKLSKLREKNGKLLTMEQIWLLEFIQINPIFSATYISDKTGVDYSKVNRTILKFVEKGILRLANESKKKRTYIYHEYLDILKE